jgi:cytoskeleton protein RodZ
MTDDVTLDVTPPPAYSPLGETLAQVRAAKKLSQQDVSNHLRFSVKQVDALENNRFDALPDAMITRGFIRNYARYLDLDSEPLLESYKARVPNKAPSAMSVKSPMYQVMSGKDNQPWLKYILGSILILLLLLAWIFYMDYMPKAAKPGTVAPATNLPHATTEVPLPEVALPAAERETPLDIVTDTGETNVTTPENGTPTTLPTIPPSTNVTPSNVTPLASENVAASDVKPNPPTVLVPSNPVSPAPTTSNSAISKPVPATTVLNGPTGTTATAIATPIALPAKAVSFSVTEKTWLNITDKSGKVVYERILPAGSSDAIDGVPPFTVIIGNAKATNLSYKGQAVNLAASTTANNVARLKLE